MGGTLGPALFSLQQQMQPQGQPQQPQASPAPQAPQEDATSQAIRALTQQLQGLPSTAQATSQLGDIQQQMQGMTPVQAPQLWQPSFKPVTGAKSLLGDIGNALLMGTGVGREIVGNVNASRQKSFENKRQSNIDQLAQLKQRQEIPETELGASSKIAEGLGSLGYKQGMLGVRQQQANTAQQRANDLRDWRQQVQSIDWAKMDEKTRHDKQDELLTSQGIQVQRDRNGVMLQTANGRIQMSEKEFDAKTINNTQGIWDQIGQLAGLKEFAGTGAGTAPLNTEAPAMQPNKPQAANTKGNAPARPSGVPSNAVWNPKTKTWQLNRK